MNDTIKHPLLLVLFLAIGAFAVGMSEFATMSLSLEIQAALHINEEQTGHIISAYALGVVVGAPLLILTMAKLPRRTTLVILMLIYAIAHFLCAIVSNYGYMLIARFIAGMPHGAYFGTAALLVSAMVNRGKRGKMVAGVFLGLSLATAIGSPLAKWLGPIVGWNMLFILVMACALLTIVGILLLIPSNYRQVKTNPLAELSGLKNPHIWITLLTGAIGFGGMFAIYSYLADTLEKVTLMPEGLEPWVFLVFGCGILVGNWLMGWGADKSVTLTVYAVLINMIVFSVTFPLIVHHEILVFIWIFMIGIGGGFGTVIQVRLMDIAGRAQLLSAALNHSAFNMANALGPLLTGLAITAGYGFEVSGDVSALLAFGGLVLWTVAIILPRYIPIPKKEAD